MGETESLRCSERLLCSETVNVKGFPLRKGDETWWTTGLMEKRGGRWMVRCVVVSAGFSGEERSKSGLASLTGERLDRNDVACCAVNVAFFFAAFFKSLCSLRLSFPGFGRMGGGGAWGWREAGGVTVISILIP